MSKSFLVPCIIPIHAFPTDRNLSVINHRETIMSAPSLNQLEIALLTKLALNPAPQKSWAERKRSQRARQAARTPEGRLLVTSDNITRSLIDAISTAIKSGHTDTSITEVIRQSSERFPVPLVAEACIRTRLASRKPVQGHGGPDHE
jgi:hypothetical protein